MANLLRVQDGAKKDIAIIDLNTGKGTVHRDVKDEAAKTFWGAVLACYATRPPYRNMIIRAASKSEHNGDLLLCPGRSEAEGDPGGDLLVYGVPGPWKSHVLRQAAARARSEGPEHGLTTEQCETLGALLELWAEDDDGEEGRSPSV